MIYVPNYSDSSCVSVLDKDTIRVYNTNDFEIATTYDYTDYFVNSHYLSREGSELIEDIPICVSNVNLTDDFYYRNDFDSILVILFIILIICFYFPYKIFSRLFGRWLKI